MNKSDLIEKYVRNKASSEELEEINRLLAEDTAFKTELAFQMEVREAIRRTEGSKMKQYLQGLEQESGSRRFRTWIKAAAVLVLVAGLGIGLFFSNSPNYETLYAENFEPYPNIVAPLVRSGDTPDSALRVAFRYYDNGNYDLAARAFKTVDSKDRFGYAHFYYAISLMADQQIEEAILALNNPVWQPPENIRYATHWYLGLGYLKLGNEKEAKRHLKKVIARQGALSAVAEKLLNHIE